MRRKMVEKRVYKTGWNDQFKPVASDAAKQLYTVQYISYTMYTPIHHVKFERSLLLKTSD